MSKSGDNIGLVWNIIYTSKKCQFEDVTIIHCTTVSCLISLLFMASLYSTLQNFFTYNNYYETNLDRIHLEHIH